MKRDMNNITDINKYRENIMPDSSGFNINEPGVPVEFVSEEFVNSYLQATSYNTPDLWSRIDAGFEIEAQNVKAKQKQRYKRVSKVVGFVAAAALITIIALPIMKLSTDSKKDMEMATESTVMENSVKGDGANDSVAMEAPYEGAASDSAEEMVAESVEEMSTEATDGLQSSANGQESSAQSPMVGDATNNHWNVGSDSETEIEAQLKDIQGIQTDARKLKIIVEFDFSNEDQVVVKITSNVSSEYTEFDINVDDKVILSNPLYIQAMDSMIYTAEITLDSVTVDSEGNITGRIIDLIRK